MGGNLSDCSHDVASKCKNDTCKPGVYKTTCEHHSIEKDGKHLYNEWEHNHSPKSNLAYCAGGWTKANSTTYICDFKNYTKRWSDPLNTVITDPNKPENYICAFGFEPDSKSPFFKCKDTNHWQESTCEGNTYWHFDRSTVFAVTHDKPKLCETKCLQNSECDAFLINTKGDCVLYKDLDFKSTTPHCEAHPGAEYWGKVKDS